MTDATLPLAIEDFLPVLLSGAAYVLVAVWIGRRHQHAAFPAMLGAALITAGGISKATSKLIVALGGSAAPLAALLFPALAAGFVTLAVVLLRRARSVTTVLPAALAGSAAVAVLLWRSAGWQAASSWFLAVAVVGSTVVSVVLIRAALSTRRRRAAGLLAAHLVITYALAGLAAVAEQTVGVQWVEQVMNTVAQGALLLGAISLRHRASRSRSGDNDAPLYTNRDPRVPTQASASIAVTGPESL